jgi:hypothetical protein
MAELVTASGFATTHGAQQAVVLAAISHAKVEVLHTQNHPRGKIKLYSEEAVKKAVAEYQAETKPKPAKTAATPSQDSAVPALLSLIHDAIESMRGAAEIQAEEDAERINQLGAKVQKVCDQNILLLRAIDGMRKDFDDRMNDVRKAATLASEGHPTPPSPIVVLTSVPKTQQKAAETEKPAKPEPEPEPRRRVAVIGLLPEQQQMVKQEFGKFFDLRFFTSDDNIASPTFKTKLEWSQTVVASLSLIRGAHHAPISAAAGDKLIKVRGGMTMMRDALMELCTSPKAAAA